MSEKQLLIESSDFNLTCNLSEKDRENLTESLKISAGKHGNLIVKNIPCTILDRRNQNGRIYPTALMQKAINEAMPKMKAKMLVCSASEHPSGSFCEPANISHAVINAYIKNVEIEVEGKKERHNVLFNDWEVLNEKSQVAAHVQQLILSGFGIGTSIRSLGSCDPDGTVTELEYLGTDIVGQPSSSTYVNMPINESVEVTTVPLTETYVVSASATNVVRDLDSALALSQQIDSANFGTVKKTSTKLDSEVDPKTGAETTMVTLETETEDEVSELDQALMMAKQAMLNGKADIDSVTIENIKEEQPKESVENNDTPLNEEEYIPESDTKNEVVDKLLYNIQHLMYYEGLTLEQACRKFCEQHENIPYEYVLEYMRPVLGESKITEAKEEKQEDPNEGKQYVLKTNQGFVAMDGNAISFVENPKEAIHFIKGKEESGVVHLSGINKILETMGIYDVEKYFKKGTTDISAPNDINIQNAENAGIEVKECGNIDMPMTEDNGSNTRFKATVKIADENGESSEDIPVSAVNMEGINAEISNLYDMKKQKGTPSIIVTDTTSNQQFIYNPETRQIEPMQTQMEAAGDLEQNGNKLSMEVDDNNKVEKEFNSPAQAAVAKAGIESGKMGGDVLLSEDDSKTNWKIAVLFNHLDFGNEEMIYNNGDSTSGQSIFNGDKPKFIRVFLYPEELGIDNPENLVTTSEGNKLINDKAIQKLENGIGAFGDIYSIKVWKRDETSKDMENKDFERHVYELEEDDQNTENDPSLSYDLENSAICAWCGDRLPKSEMRHESDLGWLCNHCARGIQSREGSLTFDEAENDIPVKNNLHYEDIEPGWYASAMNVGVVGPYNTEGELRSVLGKEVCDIADSNKGLVNINYVEPDEITAESAKIDEVIYNKPSNASDPLIKTPLEEDDNESPSVDIVFKNIDWDMNDFMTSMTMNMEDNDPVNIGDIQSKVKDLPDEATITIKVSKIPMSDDASLEKFLFNELGKKYAMKVNNAEIANISWAA